MGLEGRLRCTSRDSPGGNRVGVDKGVDEVGEAFWSYALGDENQIALFWDFGNAA